MKMTKTKLSNLEMGFFLALFSAFFFSLNIPVTKSLLSFVSPYWLASLLYFGAGLGTLIYQRLTPSMASTGVKINHQLVWFASMIFLDIAAPIAFFIGVKETDGNMVGLLSNGELFFTLLIALFVFKEKLRRLSWMALGFIVLGVVISNGALSSFEFQLGQLWILLAMLLWGIENNVSKKLSLGNPLNVVVMKGLGTGIGTLLVSILLQEIFPSWWVVALSLIAGFVIYGGSLIFYVFAQRSLGAAKVQMIQSFSPLMGGIFAWVIFQESIIFATVVGYLFVVIALILIGFDLFKDTPAKG
jgi:drug/metabolite transporter (DMT)-like permease